MPPRQVPQPTRALLQAKARDAQIPAGRRMGRIRLRGQLILSRSLQVGGLLEEVAGDGQIGVETLHLCRT